MKYFVLLCSFFLCNDVVSQCPTHDLDLGFQADVDSFLIKYPNCTVLDVDVFVGNWWGDINNFAAFDNIEIINKRFEINTIPDLKDTIGFNNLKIVNGELIIANNLNLETIIGFSQLNYIKKLRIANNENLVNLKLLETLDSIELLEIDNSQNYSVKFYPDRSSFIRRLNLYGNIDFNVKDHIIGAESLVVSNNNFIKSFSDLYDISPKGIRRLEITDFNTFETIGLNYYAEIESVRLSHILNLILNGENSISRPIELTIKNCNGFTNLEPLEIYKIRRLALSHLEDLNSLIGMQSLELLTYLELIECNKILNVDVFQNAINLEAAVIVANENLSFCSIEPICNIVNIDPQKLIIVGNNGKCKTIDSVYYYCQLSHLNDLSKINIKLYPNPASSIIFFDFPSSENIKSISILNSLGKVLRRIEPTQNYISIKELNNGVFYLKVRADDQLLTVPFIKV